MRFGLLWMLLGALCVLRAHATVTCSTLAGAVALVQAACATQADCAYTLSTPPDAALLVTGTALVRLATATLAQQALANATDARQYIWPANPAWWAAPALLVDAALTDANPSAPDPCVAEASALATSTSAPALDLIVVSMTLTTYMSKVAETSTCTDANETPLFDASGGFSACVCASGKVCTASVTTDDVVFWWVAGLMIALAVLLVLFTIIWSIHAVSIVNNLPSVTSAPRREVSIEMMSLNI